MIHFTQREIEILELMTKGYGNTEIGNSIHISMHTAKAHIRDILRKLDARNRTDAACLAIKNNIINS